MESFSRLNSQRPAIKLMKHLLPKIKVLVLTTEKASVACPPGVDGLLPTTGLIADLGKTIELIGRSGKRQL